jgi:hypothetical protein
MPWDLKTTIIMSSPGRSPLCVDLCSSVTRANSTSLTCQFCRVLAPPRLGGPIGFPRPLGAWQPAFSPAKQHDACDIEGMAHHSDIIYGYSNHVIRKMYATLVLGICIVALLCFPLPGESINYASVSAGKLKNGIRVSSLQARPCHRPLCISHHDIDRALPSPPLHPVQLRCLL